MVRFIIEGQKDIKITFHKIYIPIWLDLLFDKLKFEYPRNIHLHSNMVRFIIR